MLVYTNFQSFVIFCCTQINSYKIIFQFEDPKSKVTAEGRFVPMSTGESRLYWNPAPPKLDVAPAKVKDILFPEYQVFTLSLFQTHLDAIATNDF